MRRRPPNQGLARTQSGFRAVVRRRRGFSLLELLVVIVVAMILMGLLLPAMRQLRESAHRVVCSSNLRQQGLAVFMYEKDYGGIPYSWLLEVPKTPHELMAVHRGDDAGNWDGLGLVYYYGYCKAPSCFYCPSHHGVHTYERYERLWSEYETVYAHVDHSAEPAAGEGEGDEGDEDEEDDGGMFGRKIFTNYHYAGHLDWEVDSKKRILDRGRPFVLAADGMRTAEDFNHRIGWNALLSDGSVNWVDDNVGILDLLPEDAAAASTWDSDAYRGIWGQLID